MAQTLQALGGILLKSIPTIVLLIFLYFYLRSMLFGPLDKILRERAALNEGTRTDAESSLKEAERKIEEYEARMREARAEVYREQEDTRKSWLAEQSEQIASARQRTSTGVKTAKDQMAIEAASARQNLMETSGALADQIATAVLGGATR